MILCHCKHLNIIASIGWRRTTSKENIYDVDKKKVLQRISKMNQSFLFHWLLFKIYNIERLTSLDSKQPILNDWFSQKLKHFFNYWLNDKNVEEKEVFVFFLLLRSLGLRILLQTLNVQDLVIFFQKIATNTNVLLMWKLNWLKTNHLNRRLKYHEEKISAWEVACTKQVADKIWLFLSESIV